MGAVKGSIKGSEERDLVALRRNRLHAISEMFDMGWSIEVIAALNLTVAMEEDSSIIDRRIAYILGGTIQVPGEGVIGDPELIGELVADLDQDAFHHAKYLAQTV